MGILAFFGAALKGNSVFGPCFWIALGGYLLYRANNKENEEESAKKTEMTDSVAQTLIKETIPKKEYPKTVEAQDKPQEAKEPETLAEIQSQLTLQQREAAMCMVALFGGYANKMPQDAITYVSSQAAIFFGIPFNEATISSMLARHSDADKMINTVITIKSLKTKEFLLLTCHDFVNHSSNGKAQFLLENIAADMGYDNLQFRQLVGSRYGHSTYL